MKPAYYKIIAYFFLSILTIGISSSLHVFHHHDHHSALKNNTTNDEDDHKDDEPCELCLLSLQFNNLDYLDIDNATIVENAEDLLLNSIKTTLPRELFILDYHLRCEKNKAPPILI